MLDVKLQVMAKIEISKRIRSVGSQTTGGWEMKEDERNLLFITSKTLEVLQN